MVRVIQTLALGAALVTLASAIWRDYSLAAALRRVFTAYFAVFFMGAVVAVVARVLAGNAPPPPAETERKPAWRRKAKTARDGRKPAASTPAEAESPADGETKPAPESVPDAAETVPADR